MNSIQPYLYPLLFDIRNIDTMPNKEREDEIKRIYDKHKCNILEGDEKRINYNWGDLEHDRFGIWLFYKPSSVFLLSPRYCFRYNEKEESITLKDSLGGVCKFDDIENWGYVKRDKCTDW